ncbi:MAG: alpha/beta hydrolase [Myxococcota bacterium]
MTTIQSHRHLAFVLSLSGLLACAPSPPTPVPAQAPAAAKASQPDAEPAQAAKTAPTSKVTPAPTVRAPRPVRAAGPTDKVHLTRTTGSVEGPFPYTIVAPSSDEADLPIVIALHGRGDRAEGFCRLIERLRLPYRFIVAEAPLRWGLGSGKQWFDMKATDRPERLRRRVEELEVLASKVAKRWPKAPMPSLLGFSQGAMLALQAVTQSPERFRGVIALSGTLLETKGLAPVSVKRPVWLSAGDADRIVPLAATQQTADTLKKLGHEAEFFAFNGGHTVSDEVVTGIRTQLSQWYPRTPEAQGAEAKEKRAQ